MSTMKKGTTARRRKRRKRRRTRTTTTIPIQSTRERKRKRRTRSVRKTTGKASTSTKSTGVPQRVKTLGMPLRSLKPLPQPPLSQALSSRFSLLRRSKPLCRKKRKRKERTRRKKEGVFFISGSPFTSELFSECEGAREQKKGVQRIHPDGLTPARLERSKREWRCPRSPEWQPFQPACVQPP